MSIFFRLSHAELLKSVGADEITERVLDRFWRICYGERKSFIVLCGADIAEGEDLFLALKAVGRSGKAL